MKELIDQFTKDIDEKLLQLKITKTDLEKEVGWLSHNPDRINSLIAVANRYQSLLIELKALENQKQLLVLLTATREEK
ncbi:hypothetical protein [Lactobacillus sp.]|uniref:hypothetical protein n=1 Tax=Lactobacillus sp. TaxID=1591 RepID=UPI0019C9E875|nr:hypothetical protein [Lactobacillus sp.]MBD5429684.1 hypothetical protein [Lactobacillus sp.]